MAARLTSAGYAHADMHVFRARRPTTGAVWWPCCTAATAAKALLLLAHIDVVEAKRADWVRDPFKLIEEDGYFYARGASDDKAMAAIFVDTMVRFKKGAQTRARHQAGADLRRGNPQRLQRRELPGRKPPRTDRRRLRTQRRRRRPARPPGKRIFNGVQAGEKLYQDYHPRSDQPRRPLVAPGAGQRDLPAGRRPHAISAYEFPIEFNDATRGFFDRMSDRAGQLASAMKAI